MPSCPTRPRLGAVILKSSRAPINSGRAPPLSPISSSVRFLRRTAAAELRSSAAADLRCQLASDRLNCLSLSVLGSGEFAIPSSLPLSFSFDVECAASRVPRAPACRPWRCRGQAAGVLCQLGFFFISAGSILIRRFLIRQLIKEDTPSLPIFQIRPYKYSIFNPRSFAHFTGYVSFFQKRILVRFY